MRFSEMSPLTGKTLILEAATQSLSKKMNTEVVFVMALGEAGTRREIGEKFCPIFLHFYGVLLSSLGLF